MPTLYRCETRASTLDALPPPLRDALARWCTQHALDLTPARVWSTRCENPPGEGFFARMLGRRANPVDPDAEHTMALALLPTHVVAGSYGARSGASVVGVALGALTVSRGFALSKALAAGLPDDDGICLHGLPGSPGRPGTYFVKLGGAEADACFDAVAAAVRGGR